jgi:hypothetical protein
MVVCIISCCSSCHVSSSSMTFFCFLNCRSYRIFVTSSEQNNYVFSALPNFDKTYPWLFRIPEYITDLSLANKRVFIAGKSDNINNINK